MARHPVESWKPSASCKRDGVAFCLEGGGGGGILPLRLLIHSMDVVEGGGECAVALNHGRV